ncbi:MAG: VWA domain-containing protein, partial [Terriglobales bacterium]
RRCGANLLHCRSPLSLALQSASITWERTASRRRPAFSSHLVSTVTHGRGYNQHKVLAMQNARLLSIAATLGLLVSFNHSAGQSKPSNGGERKVDVAFLANDKRGKPVLKVAESDLEVLDNKKAPKRVLGIRDRSEVPLLLGILVDVSGSQSSSSVYALAVQAASEFANQALTGRDDKAFLERFALVPEATQLMTKDQFQALKIDLNPDEGRTALFDALGFACDARMKDDSGRDSLRVIVLLSDGEDNASHNDLKRAITSAQTAGAMIFAVDTKNYRFSPDDGFPGNVNLWELAEQTGGTAFLHLDHESVPKAFAAIKEQIDNIHVLSYVAADPKQGVQYHSLELKSTSKTKLRLRAPKGYYSNVATE